MPFDFLKIMYSSSKIVNIDTVTTDTTEIWPVIVNNFS